jgi:hypothetical protein
MERQAYLQRPEWMVSRLTELLLMGHSWKSVRNIMLMSKPEFDCLLEAAISKAQAEKRLVEAGFPKSAGKSR